MVLYGPLSASGGIPQAHALLKEDRLTALFFVWSVRAFSPSGWRFLPCDHGLDFWHQLMCVCCHPIYFDVRLMDAPAGVTQDFSFLLRCLP